MIVVRDRGTDPTGGTHVATHDRCLDEISRLRAQLQMIKAASELLLTPDGVTGEARRVVWNINALAAAPSGPGWKVK